jgi:sigma-B regulation protein RsbU (phosphoserine phosphatase)
VLNAVNEDLCIDNPHAMFVTVLLGILNGHSGQLVLANAGHPSPLAWRVGAEGAVETRVLDGRRGPPLGVSTRSRYGDDRFQLGVGECLLAYTDGISEAADEHGVLFGDDRVLQVLRGQAHTTPRELLETLMRAIKQHAGSAAQADDIALLSLMRQPSVANLQCLQLPRSLQAVEDAIEAVEALAQAHQVPMAAAHRLQLVLDEALSNVVNHGSAEDDLPSEAGDGSLAGPGGVRGALGIRLWLAVTDRHWLVELEDQGVPFDPTRVVLETPHGRLAERQLGGLGLHFMRRLCTTMHYERDGGLNRLLLAVPLDEVPARP